MWGMEPEAGKYITKMVPVKNGGDRFPYTLILSGYATNPNSFPLGNKFGLCCFGGPEGDRTLEPHGCEPCALPAELRAQMQRLLYPIPAGL